MFNRARPTVTAAIITLNEADRLRALLPALSWCDEVVVVDSGSRDGTAAVARSHGARTFVRRFDDYASQRNRALRAARGEWVLSIDADERPLPGFSGEVRRAIRSPRHAAYRVPIRSSIFGARFRYSGTQDDCPVRLFRRDAARWSGRVHETLQVRGRVGRLRRPLEHETLPDLATFLAKMHRYTSLEAAARVAAGQRPRRGEAAFAAAREVFRRLIWKHGWLDGPRGWAFCLLSGLSAWVLADRHRRSWEAARGPGDACLQPRPRPRFKQKPSRTCPVAEPLTHPPRELALPPAS